MSRRVRAAVVLVAIVGSVLGPGGGPVAARTTPGGGVVVQLVGDSLANSARSHFPDVWRIRARDGRGLWEAEEQISAAVQRGPTCVVIALGSNDVAVRRPAGAVRDDIRTVNALTASSSCVVWTTVKVRGVAFYGRDWVRAARQYNRILRVEAVGVIADWNAVAARRPGWFSGNGLHLSGAGRKAYANFLAGHAVGG